MVYIQLSARRHTAGSVHRLISIDSPLFVNVRTYKRNILAMKDEALRLCLSGVAAAAAAVHVAPTTRLVRRHRKLCSWGLFEHVRIVRGRIVETEELLP